MSTGQTPTQPAQLMQRPWSTSTFTGHGTAGAVEKPAAVRPGTKLFGRHPWWMGVADQEGGRAAALDAPRRLVLVAWGCLGVGFLIWLPGRFLFLATGHSAGRWDSTWGLAGVSFLSSVVVPIPGATAALLLALSHDPVLGLFAVLGAALGSTAGACLLLALGNAGRAHLQKRATHSAWARATLDWSTRLAMRWTYLGVAVLLVPQFIPKLVVLYAAALARLRALPYLVAVFVGVALRNLVVLGFFIWVQ